jgi:AraC-like DNA-binding protein
LQPYLECLWAVRDPRKARSARPRERIVPDGCPELIIHLGNRFARRRSAGWVVQPRVFLAGTLTRPWTPRAGPRVDTIGVRFRPGRAALVFAVPMAAATDRELRLADLVGPRAAATLMREVRAARTRDERFDAAERWLLARLARSGSRPGASLRAVDLILEARGRIRIDEVASRLGWSRRRIERSFARDLGIRPKVYARIVRLNSVLATLEPSQREAAVDVALEAGNSTRSTCGERPVSPALLSPATEGGRAHAEDMDRRRRHAQGRPERQDGVLRVSPHRPPRRRHRLLREPPLLAAHSVPAGRDGTAARRVREQGARLPQRILYWLDPQRRLHARIEDARGGQALSEEWEWVKVP